MKEYRALRQEIDVTETDFLTKFDLIYKCVYGKHTRFEWTCKVSDVAIDVNRFLVCGIRIDEEVRSELTSILQIARTPMDAPVRRLWDELLSHHCDYAHVAYAGTSGLSNQGEVLKLYLVPRLYDDLLHQSIARVSSKDSFGPCPPGAPVANIGFVVERAKAISMRLYLAYEIDQYDDKTVREYLTSILGKRGYERIKEYPATVIGFKPDGVDMTYVFMNNHDNHLGIVASNLVRRTGNIPVQKRLDRITYVGLPPTELVNDHPSVLNLYLKLD